MTLFFKTCKEFVRYCSLYYIYSMQPSTEAVYPTPGYSYCYQRFTNRRLHYNWHRHPEMELFIVDCGRGLAHIGERVVDFHAPSVFLVAGDLAHGFASDGPIEGLILQFPTGHLCGFATWAEGGQIAALIAESQRGIAFGADASAQAGAILAKLDGTHGFRRWLMILGLLEELSRDQERLTTFHDTGLGFLDRGDITDLVDSLFKESTKVKSLQEMSVRARMSKSHFCRTFKRNTGLTYLEYIHSIRINNAKKLLIQTGFYVDDICYECGFNNISFFNRKFKMLTGMTPRQYRKAYAGNG